MSTAKRKLRLVKLKKYNTIWHPDSTLVFKSQKERFVIGRLVDKELVSLDDDAIELAEQWKLKIDESLLESGSDSEEKESEDQDSQSDEGSQSEDEKQESAKESEDDEVNEEQNTPESVDILEKQREEKSTDIKVDTPKIVLHVDTSLEDNKLTNEIMQNARKTVDLINGLETKLDTVCKEKETLQLSYDELKTKYDTIMNKFNTMKSLFN